jgi:hypothetical protein
MGLADIAVGVVGCEAKKPLGMIDTIKITHTSVWRSAVVLKLMAVYNMKIIVLQ